MATVLVTGGKGFLGSHLVARLRAEDETVRIFARPGAGGQPEDAPDVFWGDIRDADAVDRAVAGVDYVIHTVSNFRSAGSDKDEAHAINVQGTENVLRACHKHGVQRLVHCSTIGVHGDVREIPATETTPFNPCDLYQETKLLAEQQVWDFHAETGLPISVVRPISMFGPGDMRMLKLFKMIQKGRFVRIGPCTSYFQPAYIDDVIDGFMLCLRHERAVGEAFIIGGDQYLRLDELFKVIAGQLGVAPPKIRLPLGPVLLLARLCELVCAPLGIEPPLHRRRVSFFVNNRAFSVDKAKKILGFQPKVSLADAISRTIAWYRDQGYLER